MLIFLVIGFSNLSAQTEWKEIDLGNTDGYKMVKFFNVNEGIIMGTNNVYLTSDRGKTWTEVNVTMGATLTDMHFVDENIGYISGGSVIAGNLFKTTDGGQTWSEIDFSANTGWLEVWFIDNIWFINENKGFASISSNKPMYVTYDGGLTWTSLSNYQYSSDIEFIDENNGWVLTNETGMNAAYTTNGGATWTPKSIGDPESGFADIFFLDSQNGWVCGGSGRVFKTTDGGATWNQQETYTSEGLSRIRFKNTSEGYAVGGNGKILYTINGGDSWYSLNLGITDWLTDVCFSGDFDMWIVGESGICLNRPQVEEICLVTVDPTYNKNMIIWEKRQTSDIVSYNVNKLISGNYYSIGTVAYDDMSTFIDYTSNPGVTAERYSLSAVDAEGVTSFNGPYHQTINLGISLGVPATNITLNWIDYEDEKGAFQPSWYYIYRGANMSDMVLHDSVTAVYTSYNDLNVFSPYYYRILVSKDAVCVASDNSKGTFELGSSLSNTDQNEAESITEYNPYDIKLYPNPMIESSQLDYSSYPQKVDNVIITDISGKLVRHYPKPEKILTIERGELPAGKYIVSLLGEKAYQIQLIIN